MVLSQSPISPRGRCECVQGGDRRQRYYQESLFYRKTHKFNIHKLFPTILKQGHSHPRTRVPNALAHPQGHIHCLLQSQSEVTSYTNPHNSPERWAPWSPPQNTHSSYQIRSSTQFVQLQVLALSTPTTSRGRRTQKGPGPLPLHSRKLEESLTTLGPRQVHRVELGVCKVPSAWLAWVCEWIIQKGLWDVILVTCTSNHLLQFPLKGSQTLAELQSGQNDSQIIFVEEQGVSQP